MTLPVPQPEWIIRDLRPRVTPGRADEFGRTFFGEPWLSVAKVDIDCWRVEVCWWYRRGDEKDFTVDAADDQVWPDRGSCENYMASRYGVAS